MNSIIDFYKSLDIFNIILFWGIIIIIFLLLIFVIIVNNKNKKLKLLVSEKNTPKESFEIPIKEENQETENKPITIETEQKFVAEEHVIDYQKDSHPDKVNSIKEEINSFPNKPYQKNVLKEMSLNQTSPIGITKPIENEKKLSQELHETLSNNTTSNIELNSYQDIIDNNQNNKTTYLKEVSEKLSKAKETEGLTRTEYELKQEEEAIISYQELMQKKDTLKIVDDETANEEAIISINELINKKNEEEKLYNITEEEANDNFINELKKFREDL